MTPKNHSPLVIGILGGGQLGRMTVQAAEKLGYSSHVYEAQKNSCAEKIAASTTVADFLDHETLAKFAKTVDVVTLEFENIPVATVKTIEKYVPVYPSSTVLAVCQDRVQEKEFCRSLNIPTAPFAAINTEDDVLKAIDAIGLPAVLKTRRMGYDGKGQAMIKTKDEALTAFKKLGGKDLILEGFVTFTKEISVIIARTKKGETAIYPIVENKHEHHILSETIAPAEIDEKAITLAKNIAQKLAEKFSLVGLLAVELFLTKNGDVLVNEMAPRPHNSGHWSMDGAKTSQFEQLVRILTEMPLGSTDIIAPTRMYNLLGDQVNDLQKWQQNPNALIHIYDKGEARVGRKMGHVNIVEK